VARKKKTESKGTAEYINCPFCERAFNINNEEAYLSDVKKCAAGVKRKKVESSSGTKCPYCGMMNQVFYAKEDSTYICLKCGGNFTPQSFLQKYRDLVTTFDSNKDYAAEARANIRKLNGDEDEDDPDVLS